MVLQHGVNLVHAVIENYDYAKMKKIAQALGFDGHTMLNVKQSISSV